MRVWFLFPLLILSGKNGKADIEKDPYAQNGHQPELNASACSILFFSDLKGHLFPLWSWWSITLQKGSFLFSVWVLFKAIHLGSLCQWAAMLEQCWVVFIDLKVSLFGFVSGTSRDRCNALPWQPSLMVVLIKWPLPSPLKQAQDCRGKDVPNCSRPFQRNVKEWITSTKQANNKGMCATFSSDLDIWDSVAGRWRAMIMTHLFSLGGCYTKLWAGSYKTEPIG